MKATVKSNVPWRAATFKTQWVIIQCTGSIIQARVGETRINCWKKKHNFWMLWCKDTKYLIRLFIFMRLLDKFQLKEALYCFFDRARSGCEHSASFKNVNMQTNMTARCNRPGVMNNLVKHNTKSFYVVESRAYSHWKRNIVRPSTPEKEANRKENTVGKIAKRWQIATDWKVYVCLDIDLGEVLFHYAVFCDKENRDFSNNVIAFRSVEFPKFFWTVKHICALFSAC